MAVADLGACEWFVMELRRSGLIERGQLEQVVGDFLKKNPRSDAKALSEYLVVQKILTAFQAERLLGGKAQGLVLGPYTLLDSIGSGSMGTVYKATSKNDGQSYAVKVLPRRSMWNVRLARRQVRAFSGFNHPSVVPFVDVGTAGGLHYLAWPLAEGKTLEAVVQQSGHLSADVAALHALQLAQGLAVAHTNGLFHGLLKPSNVLVGSDGVARILDFGIGSLLVENEGESLVDTMSTANTLTSGLDCASPESIMEPTNRTPAGDQYSLGCSLYYCLTGQYPFPEGSAVEKMMAHQTKSPPPIKQFNKDAPDGLVQVVERLMEKEPTARYTLMEEVVEALQPFAAEARAAVTANSYTETPRPITSTRPMGQSALQKAISRNNAAHAAAQAPAKVVPANLPANVRMGAKPAAAEARAAAAPEAKPAGAPNYAVPSQFADQQESTVSPITLLLGGMAIMGVSYMALQYFQLVK
ncbi:MAG: serine/threonine protein kinase [Gemmataceae bacterium]|nr:serine/threonine protein kinase [Gemmataceae bacterium]